MPGIEDLAGFGLNVGGSLLAEWLNSADEATRQRLLSQAADEYGNVSEPVLQRLVAQEGQSQFQGAPTEFGNNGSRNAAIQALMNEGLSGGNTLEDKVAQSNAQRTAGQATRASSQQALQSAASRGMGGASSTLQAQVLGASQGADRAAQVGLQGASDARQRALTALQQGGGMAGQAEQADSESDARRRESLDRMAQFNAGQRQRTNEYNSGLQQQGFQNHLAVSDRRSGADQMRANQLKEQEDVWRRRLGGGGQAAGGYFTNRAVNGGTP
jgi:hypothetical protein